MIIESIFSTADEIPIKIWARSCAFFKSKRIFLVKVSSLKLRNSEINSFKFSILGFPSTIANVLNPNEDSIEVNL